jgi:beta-alanine degradation protein BauB
MCIHPRREPAREAHRDRHYGNLLANMADVNRRWTRVGRALATQIDAAPEAAECGIWHTRLSSPSILALLMCVKPIRRQSRARERAPMKGAKLPQATAAVQVDNDQVRVTEWRFAPGAETGVHIHAMDYVIVPCMAGRLKIVAPDGLESIVELKPGGSYFRPAGVHHNVINANDFEFVFVEIELKP